MLKFNKILLFLFLLLLIYNPVYAQEYCQDLNCSAYTTVENGTITATGIRPYWGVVAADHLPFNTKVIVPGYGTFVVLDRFGGGYTNRLDIFFNDYEEAIKFGRRIIRCKIILS